MSSFTFQCQMCIKISIIKTEDDNSDMTKINTSAVIDIINTGGGYGTEIMATLEISTINNRTYDKAHDQVCDKFEEMKSGMVSYFI